jgi:hypothetical protein
MIKKVRFSALCVLAGLVVLALPMRVALAKPTTQEVHPSQELKKNKAVKPVLKKAVRKVVVVSSVPAKKGKVPGTPKPVLKNTAPPAKISAGCGPVARSKQRRHAVTCIKSAAVPADPILQSPISENALDKARPDKSGEIKARSVPDRAYAVDGDTFFYQGRKYHVSGLSHAGSNDMAKQRLQRALDAGALSVDQVGTDDSGVATANVSVSGRDLLEQLR